MVALIKDKVWKTLSFYPDRRLLLVDCKGSAEIVKIDDLFGERFFVIYTASGKEANGLIYAGLQSIGGGLQFVDQIFEDQSECAKFTLCLVFDEVTFSPEVENLLRWSSFFNVDRAVFFKYRRKLVYGNYEKARGVALL